MEIKRLVVGMVETNCYIAWNPACMEAVIVDPGSEAQRIEDALKQLSVSPKAILLTHGHFDHVMAIDDLREKFKIPVCAFESEADVLADPGINLSSQFQAGRSWRADVLLKDGQIFESAGFSFRVIHTPGHTAGSCCYYEKTEKVLFSGDTLFEGSYGRVDFPTGSGRQMIHSVASVLLELPDDTAVYPGHMGYTTIADEKKYNPLAGYRGKQI